MFQLVEATRQLGKNPISKQKIELLKNIKKPFVVWNFFIIRKNCKKFSSQLYNKKKEKICFWNWIFSWRILDNVDGFFFIHICFCCSLSTVSFFFLVDFKFFYVLCFCPSFSIIFLTDGRQRRRKRKKWYKWEHFIYEKKNIQFL